MHKKSKTTITSLTFARLLSAILVIVCTKYCELHDVASSAAATTSATLLYRYTVTQKCGLFNYAPAKANIRRRW